IKYELNKKLSIMQQSSSSQPALSTNRIPQFESRGLIGKMPNSQVSVAPKFVPEHSFPIPISQNYAAALPNGNNFHAPCNPNLIEQSNMH
ncbi:hypothetical protein, partial [Staphylococcus warneri]|uniref:hypothetical protein n=1 Tax=Staphylococcus warneri TaxID=1292 RepID=UPI0030BD42DF